MRTYTIGELAREFGVTARALRFYEDKELLHPARQGLARVYSSRDRARLKLILQGKKVGFSLSDIREILDLYSLEGHQAQIALSVRKGREQLVNLERQRCDIDAALHDLRQIVRWGEEKLASFPAGGDMADAAATPACAIAHVGETAASPH
jgi:DNA-binding transcriptional MerR regulator